jgi:hypothetical protein
MPRYVVERTFAETLLVPVPAEDGQRAEWWPEVIERDGDDGITWLHSYVSEDGKKTFCIYDGPTPEAIRKTAARNKLPIDRITQVRVLDPYSYT